MKVSVAFITYNHERFVARAVESALMQEPGCDWEIVVGEDASTDRTREIVSGYAERHPGRFRLLPPAPNLGMHRNAERTLAACAGEYVALLEGDDYWTAPDKLRRQAEYLDAHAECSLCFHEILAEYEDGSTAPPPFRRDGSRAIFTFEDIAAGNFIATCSAMFRNVPRLVFPHWFRGMPMVDWLLFLLIAERGHIGHLGETMAVYRVHGGGIWSSLSGVDVRKKSILACRILNRHMGRRCGTILKRSISMWHMEIARILEAGGDPAGAALHAVRSLAASSFGRKNLRTELLEILRNSAFGRSGAAR
ncbi:MAG: glycosyl transferase, family 2 [Actinobacteria bacterium]|nr:glycosyl transferase, family 2 [Actinomycetota bacterium]MBM2827690.1 glycosyl transferase, family 2 [Actinomycetota bacterium]